MALMYIHVHGTLLLLHVQVYMYKYMYKMYVYTTLSVTNYKTNRDSTLSQTLQLYIISCIR